MKLREAIWFTPLTGECIGIVKVQDEITGVTKFYIGTGKGIDEKADAERIMRLGAPSIR